MTTQAGERRKVRVGRVVSDGMDKTVVVAVERRVQHRLYGKSIRHLTKFQAHDENNAYRVGDVVRITETRPLSKTKRWRVTELLVRQELPEIEPAVAAEINAEEVTTASQRRRGPTRAAQRAAARRLAIGEAAPVTAKAAMDKPVAEAQETLAEEPEAAAEQAVAGESEAEVEEAPAEEEAVAAEPEAEVEEAPAEEEAVAAEPEAEADEAPVEEETTEDTKEEKGS
jgi:small subunit ribosomal protein S17